MEPLELLHEPAGLESFALPDAIAGLYPGSFGLPRECVYANFVQTIDGVVALPGVARSNRLIADGSEADLFVMALLRACADAIVIGSKTLLASPKNRWTAEAAFPAAADAFAELRRTLGLEEQPHVVVLTRARDFETTTELRERLSIRPDAAEAIGELRAGGRGRILCEGGPTLFGNLLAGGLVDELFLTVSPLFAGDGLSLVESVPLLPDLRVAASLAGVRRHGAHLFLRYAVER
ncbi:MAG TPA: dihydrofolate reductase family protein [Gaiellaceae bacterium]|nr:dihydrofolate reductase family protein [Gaiellaceae bacterium]